MKNHDPALELLKKLVREYGDYKGLRKLEDIVSEAKKILEAHNEKP